MTESPHDYPENRRKRPYSNTSEHWHLSKWFNGGTLLTVILASATGLTYINSIAGDVERIEQIQQIQNDDVKDAIKDLKDESQEHYDVIQRQNERLEDKMDKIIEKVVSVSLGES